MTYIFFSYSRRDETTARQVVNGLSGSGYVLWQDVNDLRGGTNWRDELFKAIDNAAVVVLLWSASSAASPYVKEEIQYARARSKPIIPLTMDGTPLSPDLLNIQWVKLEDGLPKLVNALPSDIRRRRVGFDPAKVLRDQAGVRAIDAQDLLCAPLLDSSYCKAFVIAPPDAQVKNPSAIHLALQFSQSVSDAMINDIYRYYTQSAPSDGSLPFVLVLVTGPTTFDSNYRLDNQNPAQWMDALGTTDEALKIVRGSEHSVLHVFNLAPASLMLALGTNFNRFFRLFIYNYIAPRERTPDSLPYQLIMVL
ncbi:MAG: toll/interleukin-1 receptor domain-containing protein [Chloroflexi bacterium]|nr:toll/interleukin-1 receptor domain-containing protein [Chloroflexota bacterium]